MQQPFPTAVQRTCTLYASALSRQFVFEHRNGVVVMGLAAGHPVRCLPADAPLSVTFSPGVTVQRKRKRGKQSGAVHAREPLCSIKSGDKVFPVVAAVNGYVLELNTSLEKDPSLLLTHVSEGMHCGNCSLTPHTPLPPQPDSSGFLAILAPAGKLRTQDSLPAQPTSAATAAGAEEGDTGEKGRARLLPLAVYEAALAAEELGEWADQSWRAK